MHDGSMFIFWRSVSSKGFCGYWFLGGFFALLLKFTLDPIQAGCLITQGNKLAQTILQLEMVLIVTCCHAIESGNKYAAAIMPGVHEVYSDLNLHEVAYNIKLGNFGGAYTIRSKLW